MGLQQFSVRLHSLSQTTILIASIPGELNDSYQVEFGGRIQTLWEKRDKVYFDRCWMASQKRYQRGQVHSQHGRDIALGVWKNRL
jgi:hypothetical protein